MFNQTKYFAKIFSAYFDTSDFFFTASAGTKASNMNTKEISRYILFVIIDVRIWVLDVWCFESWLLKSRIFISLFFPGKSKISLGFFLFHSSSPYNPFRSLHMVLITFFLFAGALTLPHGWFVFFSGVMETLLQVFLGCWWFLSTLSIWICLLDHFYSNDSMLVVILFVGASSPRLSLQVVIGKGPRLWHTWPDYCHVLLSTFDDDQNDVCLWWMEKKSCGTLNGMLDNKFHQLIKQFIP